MSSRDSDRSRYHDNYKLMNGDSEGCDCGRPDCPGFGSPPVFQQPRPLQLAAEAPGTEILGQAARAGDAHRDQAIAHVLAKKDEGYLSDTEADIRIDCLIKARTHKEIMDLTFDLPAPADTRSWSARIMQDWDFGKKVYYVPALLALLIASVCTAITSAVAVTANHLLIPVTVASSVIAVFAFCFLITKLINDN